MAIEDNVHPLLPELPTFVKLVQHDPEMAKQAVSSYVAQGIPPPFLEMSDFEKQVKAVRDFRRQQSQSNSARTNPYPGAQGSTPIMPSPQELGSLLGTGNGGRNA